MEKCPKCGVRRVAHRTDLDLGDIVLKDCDCMICPRCFEIVFTPEQSAANDRKLRALGLGWEPVLKLRRTVTYAGKQDVVSLPAEIEKITGIKKGVKVEMWATPDGKIVIEKAHRIS